MKIVNILVVTVILFAFCLFPVSAAEVADPASDTDAVSEAEPTLGEWLGTFAAEHTTEIAEVVYGVCMLLIAGLTYKFQRKTTKGNGVFAANMSVFADSLSKSVADGNATALSAVTVSNDNSTKILAALAEIEELRKQNEAIEAELGKKNEEHEITAKLMRSQAEMLNIVIQSSSMAQFKKDKIEQMFSENLKAIEKLEDEVKRECEAISV